jgi:hypothetical protein
VKPPAASPLRLAWLALIGASCTEPPPIERHVVAYAVPGCRVQGNETLLLTALGDFGAPRAASQVTANDLSKEVGLPADLVGVEAEVLPSGWSGIGYANPPDDVRFTLWSTSDACDATGGVIPASQGGQAITAFGNGKGLLLAGLEPTGDPNDAAYALALDATTGETSKALERYGLGPTRRAFATATPFGAGALVAGGLDPSNGAPHGTGLAFLEDHFVEINLGPARAHHGAAVLASGETLLVGGVGETGVVLSSMVAVDPTTQTARFLNVGTLARARKDPVVLRLATDEILVAGGTDELDAPIATLEWFASDGSACIAPRGCVHPPQELVARAGRAFVALAGGGVLAAGGFDGSRQPARDVWWITEDTGPEALELLSVSQRGDGELRLVPASDGAPFLYNGSFWLRFDPWLTRFTALTSSPGDGPDNDMPAPVAVDPGLFMWIARDQISGKSKVRGFRHGVRGPFARDDGFLLLGDALHTAPDRPPGPGGAVEFLPDGLHITHEARVVVTDTTYADVEISAATPASALPEVELGPLTIGVDCPWPRASGKAFTIARAGGNVSVEVDGQPTTCSGPPGRVSIALRGPEQGQAVVTKLAIARR